MDTETPSTSPFWRRLIYICREPLSVQLLPLWKRSNKLQMLLGMGQTRVLMMTTVSGKLIR